MKIFKKSRIYSLAAMAFMLTAPQAVLARGNHFEKVVTNKNGSLSLSEMQNAALKRFAKRDSNGDGKIAASEAKKPERFKKRLAKKDTNRDGYLSKDEMLNAIKAHYLKLDANHDGAVSQAEMKAARQNRRKNRQARRNS